MENQIKKNRLIPYIILLIVVIVFLKLLWLDTVQIFLVSQKYLVLSSMGILVLLYIGYIKDFKNFFKKILLFELEIATLSFIFLLLLGYKNIPKVFTSFFAGSCPPSLLVIASILFGIFWFSLYYFLFEKTMKIMQQKLSILFHVLAVISVATGVSGMMLCGFS